MIQYTTCSPHAHSQQSKGQRACALLSEPLMSGMASRDKSESLASPSKRMKARSVLSAKLESVGKGKSSLKKPIFCPHCERRITTKTYRKHKMLHYDEVNGVWSKAGSCSSSEILGMYSIIIIRPG